METPNFKDIPKLVVPENLFKSNQLRMDTNSTQQEPQPQPSLGYTEELNIAKKKVTPFRERWEASIKFFLNDFELIDIYRNPKFAYQRYNEPIIKYRSKADYDESKGRFPIFSRAYFKLWEVLGSSDVLARYKDIPLTVANVAEGPGGFIHGLIDFRKEQNGKDWNKDSYYAITLKGTKETDSLDWDWPRAKDYFDYARSVGHKLVLSYGGDGTGNMFKLDNVTHFATKDLDNQKCQLVTGDGGIGLSSDEEFDIQELVNAPLFYSEILYCFHIQETDGCFILKIYDIYYNVTVQLILLLRMFYEKVTIVKPNMSRPASSEKYLVCESFKGITEEQLKVLRDVLEDWVGKSGGWNGLDKSTFRESILEFDLEEANMTAFRKELAMFNKIFSDSQLAKINEGLELAKKLRIKPEEVEASKRKQKDIAIEWCKAYGIPYDENILLSSNASRAMNFNNNKDNNKDGDGDQLSQRYNNDRDSLNRGYNRNNNYNNNRHGNKNRDDDRRNPRNDRYKDRDRSRNSRSRSKSPRREKKTTINWDPKDKGDEEKLSERKKKFGIE